VQPGRITIRDQSSRWASASRDGSLSFSWRLILAPPYVLDAVVVHELAHLRVRGHNRAFWAIAEEHAARTLEARRWLRKHAREVRAALD
jgi:predicted metal-dependent hydrolase